MHIAKRQRNHKHATVELIEHLQGSCFEYPLTKVQVNTQKPYYCLETPIELQFLSLALETQKYNSVRVSCVCIGGADGLLPGFLP